MLLPFYKQCFDAWYDLNNKVPLSFREIRRDLFSIGLLKIGDLLLGKNTTTSSFTNLLLNPEQSFFF